MGEASLAVPYLHRQHDLSGVKGTANSGNTAQPQLGGLHTDSGSGAANDPTTKQGSLGLFVSTPHLG